MKRRFFIRNGILVPAALLVAPKLFAAIPFPLVSSKRASGGGGCTTAKDSAIASGADKGIGDSSFRVYDASQFTAGSTYTLCTLKISLKQTGSPTGLIKFGIYSDTGSNVPNALIGSFSATVAASSMTTSYADYTFSGLSCALTSGTKYWVVGNNSVTDASNYVNWSLGFGAGLTMTSTDGSSWSGDTSFTLYYKAFA